MSQNYIFFSARVEPLTGEHHKWLCDLYDFVQANGQGDADGLTNVERFEPYLKLFDDPDFACSGLYLDFPKEDPTYIDIGVDDTDCAKPEDAANLIYATLKHFELPHRVYFHYSYGDTSGECGGGVFEITKHGFKWKGLYELEGMMRAENEIEWKEAG